MMSKHFPPNLGKMVDNLLKYLYLKFGSCIAHNIQNISKKLKIIMLMMLNDDVIAE